jgi:hypothetical protein
MTFVLVEPRLSNRLIVWIALGSIAAGFVVLSASAQDLIDAALGVADGVKPPAVEPAPVAAAEGPPLAKGRLRRPDQRAGDETLPELDKAWQEYERNCDQTEQAITRILDKRCKDAANLQALKSAQAEVAAWLERKVWPAEALPKDNKGKVMVERDFETQFQRLEERYRATEKNLLKRRPDLAIKVNAERIAVFKPWIKEFRQRGPQGDWLFFTREGSMPGWRTIDPANEVAGAGARLEGTGNDAKNLKFRWRLDDEHLVVTWEGGDIETLEIVDINKVCAITATGRGFKDGPYWLRLDEQDEWPATPGVWQSPNAINNKRWLRFVRGGYVFEDQDLRPTWTWEWIQRPDQKGGQAPTEFKLTLPERDKSTGREILESGKPRMVAETYVVAEEDGVEVCRLKGENRLSTNIGGYRPGKPPVGRAGNRALAR